VKNKKEKFYEDIVEGIQKDFRQRQKERKNFEAQWQLNNNFLIGNQYCSINVLNEVEDYDKQYFWQEREVYNHIAPLIEARMAKLTRVRPKMTVLPVSGEECDIKSAKVTRDILNSIYEKLELHKTIEMATWWSEICGTSFYKILWNNEKGKFLGKNKNGIDIYEGEVEVVAIPPYEIFPESSSCGELNNSLSLIHAKAYDVETIKNIWGVSVEGGDVNVFTLENTQTTGGIGYNGVVGKVANGLRNNHAIVIEKYELPTIENPNGKLTIVCQNKLLYIGELPYINSENGKRTYPFIKQISNRVPGCFWGSSIIERMIPVQRAYNAVKNRKHEFLNRISMGVLTVEDGSLDMENLEEEGLSPGKVLIYRQGSNPPEMMGTGTLPADFLQEEERLVKEFSEISGVSDIMSNNSKLSTNISGVALQLMIEQDDARLLSATENIKNSVKIMAKQIIRLYKQFVFAPRINRMVNSSGTSELFYWSNSDISSDEVELETIDKLGDSLVQKREFIMSVLESGLLNDSTGKINNATRIKVLQLLGFGVWSEDLDMATLHKRYADDENINIISNKDVEILDIDNHQIHIDSHTAFMLDKTYRNIIKTNTKLKNKFLEYIKKHKTELLNMENK